MKLESEVTKQEKNGEEEGVVTLGNARRISGAFYREYNSSLQISIPLSMLKSYPIGRKVIIDIKPK